MLRGCVRILARITVRLPVEILGFWALDLHLMKRMGCVLQLPVI